MNAIAQVHVMAQRRMTPDDYRAERERIEQTYGSNSAEAGAHRDQALAALYHRSGWTQDELAKVEGAKPQYVARRLVFGRFLSFSPSGRNPQNLTERRFRSYWEQTEKDPNERVRFAAVLRLMEDETVLSRSTAQKKEIANAVLAKFADGKPHKLETICHHVGESPEEVRSVLDLMVQRGTYGTCAERIRKGTSPIVRYSIVRSSGEALDKATLRRVLHEELEPLLNGLAEQGGKNAATVSISTVAHLTAELRKVLEKLAK
jgi:hypothetical protein